MPVYIYYSVAYLNYKQVFVFTQINPNLVLVWAFYLLMGLPEEE